MEILILMVLLFVIIRENLTLRRPYTNHVPLYTLYKNKIYKTSHLISYLFNKIKYITKYHSVFMSLKRYFPVPVFLLIQFFVITFYIQIASAANYRLTLDIRGSGSGTVTGHITGSPSDFSTNSDISVLLPVNASGTLTATPSQYSIFSGWGGACESPRVTSICNLVMDDNKTVTATFNSAQLIPYKVQIERSGGDVYFDTLQSAIDSAKTGETIKSKNVRFDENIVAKTGEQISISGGYNDNFSWKTGVSSILNGSLKIPRGKLIVSDLILTDTTPPTVPANLAGTVVSSSQINLSWNVSTDNIGVTRYLLERCQGAGCSSFSQIATPTTTSYNNTGMTASTSYTYRIRAVDGAGNLSDYSTTLTKITPAGGDTTPPTAPANLTGTVVSNSQINLSWTASTDNVGVTGYRLERCQGGAGCISFGQIATPTTANYNNTGLTASTSYTYRVRAVDGAGNLSAYSTTLTKITPAGGDTTPPTAPANLTGIVVSSSQINLSWTASTDNVGVTGYKIYGDDNFFLTPLYFIKNATGTSASMTGLAVSTQYCFLVSAFDADGNESFLSNKYCATTLGSGLTTVTLYAVKDAEIFTSDTDTSTADKNYGISTLMELGNNWTWGYYFDDNSHAAILIDFAFDPSIWYGKSIVSAKLRLYVQESAVDKTGRYIAYKINDTLINGNHQSPWSETGVTWNNAPPYALSSTSTADPPSNSDEYTEWDVTPMAQEWFTTGTMGNGIIIKDMNSAVICTLPGCSAIWHITNYFSRSYSNQAYHPKLIITY